jgi:cytochrome c-type biogenesis protein CcmE
MSMTRKQKRLAVIGGIGVVLALALGLILTALKDQIVFFRSPTEVVQGKVKPGESFRLGGLVEAGSVSREAGQIVRFVVTDGANAVKVSYQGLLPDLFREGQGVVTEGRLDAAGAFSATNVLAKHDENYMPREVADTLKKQGVWRDDAKDKGAKP